MLEINLHNVDDQMMDYILDICLYKGLFLILQKLFSEVSQAPPSAITVVPVRSSPAELAMYSTALPMSSRRPRRWTGIDFTKSSVILFPPTKFIQYCYNIIHVPYKSTQHNMYWLYINIILYPVFWQKAFNTAVWRYHESMHSINLNMK